MATEQEGTRKLTAILSADVKGYSTLMTNDEASTIKTLKEYRNIMSGVINDHSGNVVDMPGDNIMAEFSSVVNAVKSAVAIQKALQLKNDELSNDKRLEFRIGINIGDVVQDGSSLYGEGVNIAARIEGLADPGGICISRGAYDHIRNKLKLGYEYIGEHAVKNIKNPVRVYKILMAPEDAGKLIGGGQKSLLKTLAWSTVIVAGIIFIVYLFTQNPEEPEFEPASVENMAHPLPDKPSIAVLAFDNMSGDPDQEYFSDGISEDIITTLSKSDDLFIVARNSSFRYKGKPVNIKQVAEELGVRYVLEGSVRRSEDRIRITAQLIDAVEGNHLWAERYERDIKDIFALQDEITLKIVTALEVKLTEGEQVLRGRRYPNLDVKLKFMEVLSLWRKGTQESLMRHGQLSQELIDMAPEFEGGYVHLGWHYYHLAGMGKSPQESIGKALKLAQKALSLNESDSFAYALLSSLYVWTRAYDKAIAAGKRGVALNPNGADNHVVLGMTLCWADKQDDSIGHIKQAIRLDPFPQYYYYQWLSYNYTNLRQYEKALSEIKKALLISPDNFYANIHLAAVYALLERQEEAESAAKKALEIDPKYTVERTSKTLPFKNKTYLKFYADALVKAGLPYKPPLPLPDKPSIAVLAFDNMSGDPEQEYFGDGISESIIATLSKIGQLFVIARNSSFTYKGKAVKVQQVARDLGVRYVLEGSVQKTEDRVRITAQLIDALSGHHLWSERYDRELKEIFNLQDDIVMKIVTAMQVKLTHGEELRFLEKEFTDFNAYLKYLEAISEWQKGTKEGMIRYGKLAQEIIDMEPESQVGYRTLGWYHRYLAQNRVSPEENFRKAFSFAQKALSLDKNDGLTHSLLCGLYYSTRNHEKAISAGKQAVKLQPNSSQVFLLLGSALCYDEQYDQGIIHCKQGIRLNPLPYVYSFTSLGRCYYANGQYEEALIELKKAVQLAPDSGLANLLLAIVHGLLGQEEEAQKSAKKALEINPHFSISRISQGWAYKTKNNLPKVIDAMRKAGFPE